MIIFDKFIHDADYVWDVVEFEYQINSKPYVQGIDWIKWSWAAHSARRGDDTV